MTEEEERVAYRRIVDAINDHVQKSGRTRDEILNELEEDVDL